MSLEPRGPCPFSTRERGRVGQEGVASLPAQAQAQVQVQPPWAGGGGAGGSAASPSGFPFFAVDLEQVLELDSLEYLEALECVTERLESRVNFCKAHLMMITCFDVTSRRR